MLTQTLALMIPIIAVVLGIGLAMLAVYLEYRKRKDVFALYHQERMAAIEKGIDLPALPDDLFEKAGRVSPPRRHLLKGLMWLFIGLGAMIAVYAVVDLPHALFGLIPVGIGLAHLIYYFVEAKHESPSGPANTGSATSTVREVRV